MVGYRYKMIFIGIFLLSFKIAMSQNSFFSYENKELPYFQNPLFDKEQFFPKICSSLKVKQVKVYVKVKSQKRNLVYIFNYYENGRIQSKYTNENGNLNLEYEDIYLKDSMIRKYQSWSLKFLLDKNSRIIKNITNNIIYTYNESGFPESIKMLDSNFKIIQEYYYKYGQSLTQDTLYLYSCNNNLNLDSYYIFNKNGANIEMEVCGIEKDKSISIYEMDSNVKIINIKTEPTKNPVIISDYTYNSKGQLVFKNYFDTIKTIESINYQKIFHYNKYGEIKTEKEINFKNNIRPYRTLLYKYIYR